MSTRANRAASAANLLRTTVPARLERLPWGRFHTLVVVALGITWILDGLEVTLAGSVAGALRESPTLGFDDTDVGLAGAAYLAGAVLGGLYFGWLTDRLGRKTLFFVTLAVYLVATAMTGLAWNGWSFFVFRFITGAGIGGEYTAINSTIQEFIPARYRGWTDILINGSYWIGAAMGAGGAIVLLDPALLPPDVGWRVAFLIGAALGLFILLLRLWLPESPRWLVIHGRAREADRVMTRIEDGFRARGLALDDGAGLAPIVLRPRKSTPLAEVFDVLFRRRRRRTLVGLALMTAQAFFYNAIFFTYALVLTKFYGVPGKDVGWHILPFALANVLGPILLGRFFDTLGRRAMMAITYGASGALIILFGGLFAADALTATTQTLGWMLLFFFASPAASSAYLSVSESFPIEIRALAIATFYSLGTGVGGVVAPFVFGALIQTGSRADLFLGYLFGGALMLFGALVAALWAAPAERKPLEEVASPLSLAE